MQLKTGILRRQHNEKNDIDWRFVKMNQLKWCCEQKNGIKIIGMNENLSEAYIQKSDNDFEDAQKTSEGWKPIIAYYSCYNALYSLLMKAGIKSEIHECTIALMSYFGFDEFDIKFIEMMKKNRIDCQYYLKELPAIDFDPVKNFLVKCKEKLRSIDFESVIDQIKRDIK